MVQAAVADVVGPAVAAHDPDAAWHERVSHRVELGGTDGLEFGQQRAQPRDTLSLRRDRCFVSAFGCEDLVDEVAGKLRGELLHEGLRQLPLLVDCQPETEAEFGVVLEERVRPCRAAPLAVRAIGRGGQVASVDGGTTRGVGDQRAIAEQLRQQLHVRRLAAAGARAGELEQGLEELTVLRVLPKCGAVRLRDLQEVFEVVALTLAMLAEHLHVDRLAARLGLVLGRADLDAQRAAGAVLGCDLQGVLEAGVVL